MGMTAEQIAEKQVRRAQASTQDYKNGVNSVKEAPGKKAAEAVERYAAGIQKAIADGSYVDGCNSVSLSDWQARTVNKGAANYAPGIVAAQATIADFHQQRSQAQASIDAELQSMPRGDLETNLQRAMTQMRRMGEFKFRKRRR
jgi:multidrug resistance efflux pump